MPALLFDLDGTMLESDPIHRAVFKELLAERGIEMDEAFYATHIHGRLNTDFFAEFLPDEPDPQGLSDLKEAEFRRRLPNPYPAMPGLISFLETAQRLEWKRAVVTNANRLNAEAMLAAIGARAYFDVLIIAEECARGKPDPLPYQTAMQALGVSPDEAIAFEDSPSGLRAAKGSGAYTIGMRTGLSDAHLRAAGAQAILTDFQDPQLARLLSRFEAMAG